MDKKMNAVEYAIKVTSFRKLVRDICRKNGMDYPSDEKVAEWIEQGYGMENVDDFIKDYTEKQGIFREPIADFIKELRKHGIKESDDFIKDWVSKNGYNIDKFVNESIVNSYEPIERLALLATLELADEDLVALWNYFIEESAKYGEDSYIYDLRNDTDMIFITNNFPKDIKAEITRINTDFNLHGKTLRFIQWHNLNDGKVYAKEDIKGIILAYWSDIFERIMLYPSLYNTLYLSKKEYFEDIIWPIFVKELGYTMNYNSGEVKRISK